MIQLRYSKRVEGIIQAEKTMSKSSKETYTIDSMKWDMIRTKIFKIRGLTKAFLRHELLKV